MAAATACVMLWVTPIQHLQGCSSENKNYTPQGDYLYRSTRTSTHGIASISMHSHSYITRAVAAMDSCFTLIRVHQHDIAVRPLYGQSRFQRLLGLKALYVQNSKELKP